MKNISIIIASLILTNSCGKSIDPELLFKNESSFNLIIHDTINGTYSNLVSDTITIDSEKITKLKEWLVDNSSHWKGSIASYAMSNISIIGNDFRFLIYKDFVVIGFVDNMGKQRQYTRPANRSDFDFLINK